MKRKLFSVLLSAFALLLLMGAGPAPAREAAMLAEEESAAVYGAALKTEVQSSIEAGQPRLLSGVNMTVPAQAVNTDDKLWIDGEHAPNNLGKSYHNGVTYVALEPMAKLLDAAAQYHWDAATGTATVTSAKLRLSAKLGRRYVEANGRYLYLPEKIALENDKLVLPLSTVVECFGGDIYWNPETKITSVARGTGGIVSGDQYYNADNLFWLSRVIFAESGNQPLEGMISVGTVVMNRVASPAYPNTVKGVLAQRNQFSTYQGGSLANRKPNANSVIAAKIVLDGGRVEETEHALYFDACSNSWAARHRACIAVIGDHKFYN